MKSTLFALLPLALLLSSSPASVDACAPWNKRDVENAKRAAQPGYIAQHNAHAHLHRRAAAIHARQGTTTTTTSSGTTTTTTSSGGATAPTNSGTISSPNAPGATGATTSLSIGPPAPVPTDPFATIPLSQITSGAATQPTPPLASIPTAGATPPLSGAPPLPAATLVIADYPPENTVPPVNSPQVTQWMKALDGVDPAVLAIPPTADGTCGGSPTSAANASASGTCWWTCGGCTNPQEDIVTCPDKLTWGLSADDGPSPYTPILLDYLANQKPNPITTTFFVVGSRVLERPSYLQAEYLAGHHIAVHTWSHSVPLTVLSNEQVVAELGWSRQIIQEVLGVTPLYFRPPWGDIDNRVRAIALAMGLRPIIWTRDPTTLAQFDTNDWQVPAGRFTGEQAHAIFESLLQNATKLDTGFIVLEHDLWEQEVDLAVYYNLPAAISDPAGFKLMNIMECQGNDLTEAYLETITNKSAIPTYPGAGSGIDVSGNGTTVASGNTAQGSGAMSNGLGVSLGLVLGSWVGALLLQS